MSFGLIWLLVMLAACFAWACIATAVAIANDAATSVWREAAKEWQLTSEAYRDRVQASSLSEYHAARQIAMQPRDEPAHVEYDYDDTGLNRSVRPVADDDDQ